MLESGAFPPGGTKTAAPGLKRNAILLTVGFHARAERTLNSLHHIRLHTARQWPCAVRRRDANADSQLFGTA